MPGCLLACVAGDASLRKNLPLDPPALSSYNKMSTGDLVEKLKGSGVLSDKTASELEKAEGDFNRAYQELLKSIPDLSKAAQCKEGAVLLLAESLFGVQLFTEYLEIVTPPDLSYEKTEEGTVDLLGRLGELFKDMVGGIWTQFFPRDEFSMTVDATAQFWVSCLYSNSPEEMRRGFCNIYQAKAINRLKLKSRAPETKSKDVLSDPAAVPYVKEAKEKLSQLREGIEKSSKKGLDKLFEGDFRYSEPFGVAPDRDLFLQP